MVMVLAKFSMPFSTELFPEFWAFIPIDTIVSAINKYVFFFISYLIIYTRKSDFVYSE